MGDTGHLGQSEQRQTEGEAELEIGSEVRVAEEGVGEGGPALDELELGWDAFVDLEGRWQPSGDRVLGQDALGEAVQGGDHRLVDCARGLAATSPLSGVGQPPGRRGPLQGDPDAVAQLGGGGFGECDRRQPRRLRDPTGGEETHDPPDERGRLPGARPGLDEQVSLEVVLDRVARIAVGEQAGAGRHDESHPSSSSLLASARPT